MNQRQLRSYVEALLRGRRPPSIPVDDEAAADIRAAITLRGARPGSGAPSEEFLSGLHRRLAAELATGGSEPADPAGAAGPSGTAPATGRATNRRQVIQVTSVAAASMAAGAAGGVGLERAMVGAASPPSATPPSATAGQQIHPNTGTWQQVTTTAELPEGAVHAFDLGTVTGFVRRRDGRLSAVSGICTHRQCRLVFEGRSDELTCPCHRAAFTLTGEVLRHQFPAAPPPLPQLEVREIDGAVQVYAP